MTREQSSASRGIPWVRLLLGLGVLAALIVWLTPSWAQLRDEVDFDPSYAALGLLGTSLATAVTAARWKLMTEALGGTRLRYGIYFHTLALTRMLGIVSSPLVMDLIGRGVGLRAAGSERGLGHAATPVVVERVFDLLLPVVLLGWVWWVHVGAPTSSPWLSFVLVLGVFGVVATPLLAPLASIALRIYHRLRRLRDADSEAPEPPLITLRLSLGIMTLSLVRFVAVVFQFWAVGAAAGVRLDAIAILSSTPVAQITSLLGFTPAGLGFQEAGWAGALTWLELEQAAIVVFVLAARLFVVANFAILSLVSLGARGPRRERSSVPADRDPDR